LSYKFKIMKKTILILVAVYLFTGCSQSRNAQSTTTGESLAKAVSAPGRGKGANVSEMTSKAVRNFWEMFGDSKNENWFHVGTTGSLAEFEDMGIHYRAFFDKKGNWVYTLKTYTEKEMPRDVRALVRSEYYDYTIGWVKEVNQAQLVVYLVHIENEQEFKTIRVADGEMTVAEEFVKY
jgi:hypothetical protein